MDVAVTGMDWMAARLKEIRRKPIELARHLGIQPPRVYEMISGKRKMQSDEIAPTAAFLEWPVNVVMDLVSGKPSGRTVAREAAGAGGSQPLYDLPRNLPIRAAKPLQSQKGEFALGKTIIDYARRFPRLTNRSDIFGVYLQGSDMAPWRETGQLVLFEENRPPKEGDYVLVELHKRKKNGHANLTHEEIPAMIKKLVKASSKVIVLAQFNPAKEFPVPRAAIVQMYRVLLWEEIIS